VRFRLPPPTRMRG